jgi:N-hydroxyarylamine O-acetyltransferase
MRDLDAYLERIGLAGRPTITEVHRAHVTSIPFESLDPYCGIPLSLALDDLEDKLVARRRGGYCFEQNLLLSAAFEAHGVEVDWFLARVRLNAAPGAVRPRAHLVLRVRTEGSAWLADAGFGLGTPLEPVPFEAGVAHEQAGWRFRLVEQAAELVLQSEVDDRWIDLYAFVPEAVPFTDIETSNWFTSTHPRSPFVSGVIVGAHDGDGTRRMLRDWDGTGLALKEQTPAGSTLTDVADQELPDVLAQTFGLPGFGLGPDGRLAPAPERYATSRSS